MSDTSSTQPTTPCLSCLTGNGRPYSVAFEGGVKSVRMRCPDCQREWIVRERAPRDPLTEAPR
jgi:hypothetical protein